LARSRKVKPHLSLATVRWHPFTVRYDPAGIESTPAGSLAVPMGRMVKNILKIPPGTAEMIHMVRLPTGTLKLSRLWGRELR